MSIETVKAPRGQEEKRKLPAGWRLVKLREVTRVISGQHILESDYNQNGCGIGYLTGPADFGVMKPQVTKWTEKPKVICEPRDVLVTVKGAGVGKINLSPDVPVAIGRQLMAIRGHCDSVDMLFLYRFLATCFGHFQRSATGATVPGLSREDLESLTIPLPSMEEQQRIAGVLREQLALVEKASIAAQTRLDTIKALPAAFLRQVFPQPGQPLPDGWRWVKLGEVCAIKGGKRLPSGTDFVNDHTPYPYIRVVDFSEGTVDMRNLRYLDKITQSAISRYTIGKDDVYISIAGSIGIVGTIPDSLDGTNLTENAAKLVIFDKDDISRDYLARFLMSSMGQGFIIKRTNTVGQPKLALTRIATIPIPLLPLAEQQRISGVLHDQMAAAETSRIAAEEELNTINALPAALLRRAFNGEL